MASFLAMTFTDGETPSTAPSEGALSNRILLGLLLGAVCGIGANLFLVPRVPDAVEAANRWVFVPVGQVFLRMLFMVVIPLVFSSLALGVASLGDLKRLGRVGARTMGFFLSVTAFSVAIGLVLVNIVPRNPVDAAAKGDMLGVIFFALLFGIGVTKLAAEKQALWMKLLEGLADVTVVIIGMALKIAPFGVFGLIFSVTSRFGFDILRQLLLFVVTVLLGLTLLILGVYPLYLRFRAGVSPWAFLKKMRPVMITAFSTSSSNATLPTTIEVSERDLGVPPQIAGFVLPLGATMNMNGTALFEGISCVFLAQVFGVHLSLGQQLFVIVLAVLTAIGTAGVPGGSIPLLVLVLTSVGVPAEGIAVIIGVDRLLDMARTVPNVVGDAVCAVYVAKKEGFALTI
ncbi:MAG: dicarboxylate/amino acid:cation symporter [Deltaproteobacteria bacterium]|nr:dicarboxylate/amino acid:cation symporter [Deltaproteobacteria bacterium]